MDTFSENIHTAYSTVESVSTDLLLSPVHISNNIEATLLNATSRTILSRKSNVALTLLPVWTGLYMYN